MCTLCKKFASKELSPKKIMAQINTKLKKSKSLEDTGHLMELSAKILDREIPMEQKGPGIEEGWFYKTEED